MKHGKNVVWFLTQHWVKQGGKCEGLPSHLQHAIRSSDEARSSAIHNVVGSCFNSIPEKKLENLSFENIERRVKIDDIDYIELSTLPKGNIPWFTMTKIIERYPEKIILPTGKWKPCPKGTKGEYYLEFDPNKGHKYLTGTNDLPEIKKQLNL